VLPGQTRKYGLSGALLGSQTGAMLVPGRAQRCDYWPGAGALKKPGTIRVVMEPPIETLGRDPRELNSEGAGVGRGDAGDSAVSLSRRCAPSGHCCAVRNILSRAP